MKRATGLFHFRAYNLRIESNIPLPELPSCSGGSDVRIQVMPAEQCPSDRRIEWDYLRGEARFCFPEAGRFLVRGGSEVIVTPGYGVDSKLLPLYIQGMMLAAILSQRGCFVLHSSVVNVNGRAIAFIGTPGAGKSSFASAFHLLGCPVVADDNAAIRVGRQPLVVPGFPSLKIYPDVAEALGHRRTILRPIHDSQPKQAQSVARDFSATSLPLDRIYSLDRDAPEALTRLTPIEAITDLIRHSVPARWGARCDGAHLKMCTTLAASAPLFRVRTFTQLEEISSLASGIYKHCGGAEEQEQEAAWESAAK